jgi:acyl-CoA hydrolase
MTASFLSEPDACVDDVIARLGKRLVLGTPLGIGKPRALLNALYRRAKRDSSLELEVITGLSLNPPVGKSELEERFYRPIRARVWGDVPRLDFLDDLEARRLPDNVRISEFYVRAGAILHNDQAQQHYISSNYSHVARDMMARGVNVVMQAVALREEGERRRYSWSGNPDVTLELVRRLDASGRPYVLVGQVSRSLPWFGGACELPEASLHTVLDRPDLDHAPFAVPHEPVDDFGWAIGLRAAALVRDGGTLQVGIGALGDAACHALRLRQRGDGTYGRILDALGRDPVDDVGGDGPFEIGLYAASELISFPLFVLFEEGIIRRRVHEDREAQRDALAGEARDGGTALQGAFFIGPAEFYRRLSALSEERRALIDMNGVAEVNRVYTQYQLEKLQRREARFLNMTLKATLLGAAVSDQLADGKVLSGVGGQSDFVAMAHQLPGARSALLFRATARRAGELESNVVFQYVHNTIPRHMRDLFVTEYGVADLRSKSDAECVEAMLAISDSRCQEALIVEAKRAGKLAANYRLPESAKSNTPERVRAALRPFRPALLPDLPFGSDITAEEWALGAKLKRLASTAQSARGKLELARAFAAPESGDHPAVRFALAHLQLDAPHSAHEHLLARLVRTAHAL